MSSMYEQSNTDYLKTTINTNQTKDILGVTTPLFSIINYDTFDTGHIRYDSKTQTEQHNQTFQQHQQTNQQFQKTDNSNKQLGIIQKIEFEINNNNIDVKMTVKTLNQQVIVTIDNNNEITKQFNVNNFIGKPCVINLNNQSAEFVEMFK